jgi:hypothetical protein
MWGPPYMNRFSRWQHWLVLISFAIAAAAFFVGSNYLLASSLPYELSRSIADALIVSVIVSLAVEPRLLRYFGNELSSQTFWASFYSRAPESFKESVKKLASTDRFVVEAHWSINFDWADEEKCVIRLFIESVLHVENRGPRPSVLKPNYFVYESQFPEFAAEFHSYKIACQDPVFYGDAMKDGYLNSGHFRDGTLRIRPAKGSGAFFEVSPGRRYTSVTSATTYVGPIGHFPLVTTTPTLKTVLNFDGSALPSLYLSVMSPGLGEASTAMDGPGQDFRAKEDIQIGEVALTGQAILLSWKFEAPGSYDPS